MRRFAKCDVVNLGGALPWCCIHAGPPQRDAGLGGASLPDIKGRPEGGLCVVATSTCAVPVRPKLSSFVQSHCARPKHTCDQTAKDDVIGNVHSVVPTNVPRYHVVGISV